tara:strand:- start:1193 stop:2170 length:978 start_codon:yes stop_codon:yes gene_type:complete
MAHYAFLNNDHTTETLREELEVLSSEMGNLTSIEEPTQEDTAAIEAKQAEIDAKKQEIDNALCVVTGVITGVLETYEKSARDETLEKEIKDLEDSRTGKTKEEVTAIEAEIQVKLEEFHALSPEVIDNTVYWEGYYGKGGLCKRTSYNTIGGVHQNGGTPFRKNFAGVGYTYNPVADAFYAPQPFESWTLNEDTCLWECPIEKPEGKYWWKEDTQEWVDYLYLSQPYNSEPPYPSWTWSTETGWTAPVEKVEGKNYWNEEAQEWTTSLLTREKPYPSWIIVDIDVSPDVFQDGTSIYSDWVAPVDKPNDGKSYLWDEETVNWIEV